MDYVPHIHAEYIHAFADGKPIQRQRPEATEWQDCAREGALQPAWLPENKYRVKPVAVEPEYPASTISDPALWDAWNSTSGNSITLLRAIADASVRHELEVGNLVLAPKKD